MRNFFSCDVEFSAEIDQVTFSRSILDTNSASADPYLNKLLIKSPHGKANAKDVAQKLGMSQRTPRPTPRV
jgi:hypothetical protein